MSRHYLAEQIADKLFKAAVSNGEILGNKYEDALEKLPKTDPKVMQEAQDKAMVKLYKVALGDNTKTISVNQLISTRPGLTPKQINKKIKTLQKNAIKEQAKEAAKGTEGVRHDSSSQISSPSTEGLSRTPSQSSSHTR